MKRSEVVQIIADWGKPEIFMDVYAGNTLEWADNLLFTLESEIGMYPPSIPTNASGWEIGKGAPSHLNIWEEE